MRWSGLLIGSPAVIPTGTPRRAAGPCGWRWGGAAAPEAVVPPEARGGGRGYGCPLANPREWRVVGRWPGPNIPELRV